MQWATKVGKVVLCLNQIWRGGRLVKKRVEWLDDISIRMATVLCIEATATKE